MWDCSGCWYAMLNRQLFGVIVLVVLASVFLSLIFLRLSSHGSICLTLVYTLHHFASCRTPARVLPAISFTLLFSLESFLSSIFVCWHPLAKGKWKASGAFQQGDGWINRRMLFCVYLSILADLTWCWQFIGLIAAIRRSLKPSVESIHWIVFTG